MKKIRLTNTPSFCTKSFWVPGVIWFALTRTDRQILPGRPRVADVQPQDQMSQVAICWALKGRFCVMEHNPTRHTLLSTAGAEGWQISFLPSSGFEESSKIGGQCNGRVDTAVFDRFSPVPAAVCEVSGAELDRLFCVLQERQGRIDLRQLCSLWAARLRSDSLLHQSTY